MLTIERGTTKTLDLFVTDEVGAPIDLTVGTPVVRLLAGRQFRSAPADLVLNRVVNVVPGELDVNDQPIVNLVRTTLTAAETAALPSGDCYAQLQTTFGIDVYRTQPPFVLSIVDSLVEETP